MMWDFWVITGKQPWTTQAVRRYEYRTYMQLQKWKGDLLPPAEWGWRIEVNSLMPITTTTDPAP